MKFRTGVVLLLAVVGLLALVKASVGSVIPESTWTVSDALTLIYDIDEDFGKDLVSKGLSRNKLDFERLAATPAICRNREALKFVFREHSSAAKMAKDSPVKYFTLTGIRYITEGVNKTTFYKKLHKMPEQERNKALKNVCAIKEALDIDI